MNVKDITPGTRVRFTADWRAQLRAGGVSSGHIERYSRGVAVHVETAPHWTVVSYQAADGTLHHAAPDCLEQDTTDDITARIRRPVS